MEPGMNSRERLLTAMMFGFEPPERLAGSSELERAERLLSLGVGDVLGFHVPAGFHPDVKVRSY